MAERVLSLKDPVSMRLTTESRTARNQRRKKLPIITSRIHARSVKIAAATLRKKRIRVKGKITTLGTGTCQIQKHRMASSVIVELENLRLVYDFGRGTTQRLAEAGFAHNDINHIVLSHFHPDHLSDLIPFLHAASWSRIDPRNKDLNIYGIPGIKTLFKKIIGLFEPGDLLQPNFHLNIHEIAEDKLSIDKYEFLFCELPPANNRGLKFEFEGRVCAFTGDSDFHKQEIEFLKEVDFAVIDSGHITDENIVELAAATQAKTLICSHLYRELDESKLNSEALKKGYQGNLIVPKDLMEFNI